jgi:hypothetical protein
MSEHFDNSDDEREHKKKQR